MITAVVTFKLQPGTTREDALAIFRTTAPNYVGLHGLVRKYYLHGDNETAGGVYLWSNREAAETAFGPAWRRLVTEKYGVEPDVRFFETPIIVDNVADTPITEHA